MKNSIPNNGAAETTEASLYDGPSTHDISTSKLSPAERSFFRAFNASTTQEKRGWLETLKSIIKQISPYNEVDDLRDQAEEKRALEEVAQNRITYVFRSASHRYYFAQLMQTAKEQLSALHDSRLVYSQLNTVFGIEPFKNEVKVANVEGQKARHTFTVDNTSEYTHENSHRTSEEIQELIDSRERPQLSDKAKEIAEIALRKCRQKIDVFDDALIEVGGKTARKKLNFILSGTESAQQFTPEMTLYTAWKSGNACHEKPVLKSAADAEALAEVMACAWKELFSVFTDRPAALSDNNIDLVCNRFASRVYKHDQGIEQRIKDRPSPKKGNGAIVAAVAATIVAPIQSEQSPKPSFFELERESADIIAHLDTHARSMARTARNAATLLTTAHSTIEAVSATEDASVKDLGAMLLSPFNLMTAAKALDADAPLKGRKPVNGSSLNDNAKHLHFLYSASPAAHALIDQSMQDERVLLLAPLTLGHDKCKNVISSYVTSLRERKDVEERIAMRRCKFSDLGLSDAELFATFPDDKDIQKLMRDQAILDALNTHSTRVIGKIAEAVQLAVNGRRPKDIETAGVAEPEAHHTQQQVPTAWVKSFGHEFSHEPAPDNPKHFILLSKAFPYKNRELRYTASETALKDTIQGLRAECEYHRSNTKLIAELGSEMGFQVATVQGSPMLRHQEYAITVPLNMEEEKLSQQLVVAKERFDECWLQQISLVENAKHAGIKIPSRTYLSRDDVAQAQDALRQAQGRDSALSLPSPVSSVFHGNTASSEPFLWQPGEGETVIIFDTSTLKKFTAPRGGNGHTWLDMVKATARLPNVRVIIPEVVAEWEMQGRIPTFDKQGNRTGTELVDNNYILQENMLSHIAAAGKHFLEGASYGRLQEDGSIRLSEGTNKNIIVVGTPGDHDLYARIHRIAQGNAKQTHEGLGDEIHKRGEGERSIDRIVNGITFKAPIVIVSDDIAYLRNDAPTRTGGGSSVSHTSSRDYFNAEVSAGLERTYTLGKEMNGHHPITLAAISVDSFNFTQRFGRENSPLFHYNTTPIDPHSGEPNDIYAVIRRGSVLAQAGVKKNSNVATGEKSWVEAEHGRRAPVTSLEPDNSMTNGYRK